MEIQTKTIEIKFKKPLSLDFIKNAIDKKNIEAVRWGITSIENGIATVSVSYIN